MLTIELLRAVARGNHPELRITQQVIEFCKLLSKPGITVDTVVEAFLGEAHSDLAPAETSDEGPSDDADVESEDVILACLGCC